MTYENPIDGTHLVKHKVKYTITYLIVNKASAGKLMEAECEILSQ